MCCKLMEVYEIHPAPRKWLRDTLMLGLPGGLSPTAPLWPPIGEDAQFLYLLCNIFKISLLLLICVCTNMCRTVKCLILLHSNLF